MGARNLTLRDGFFAGTFAAGLATVAMLLLRLTQDTPTLPELIAEWITTWLPAQALGAALDALGNLTKALVFSGLFALQVLAGGVLGALLVPRWQRGRGSARLAVEGLLLALALYLAELVALRPAASLAGAAIPLVIYGVATALFTRFLVPRAGTAIALPELTVPNSPDAPDADVAEPRSLSDQALIQEGEHPPGAQEPETPHARRRRLLEQVSWSAAALVGGVSLWRYFTSPDSNPLGAAMAASPGSRGTARAPGQPVEEVTPNSAFYRVSKNLRDPQVVAATWRLNITGLVRKPISLSYDELLALPAQGQWQTLACISNAVGGDYLGTAWWEGVPVTDLLALAGGLDPRARRVVLRAADGYADSLPLALAQRPQTLLATRMNGESLPPEHGHPTRLLVPGVYGLKNVKWVYHLEVVDTEFVGYWQQRGWTDTAIVKTLARIDVPAAGNLAQAAVQRIAGIAFAGDRGISRVEVSHDGGATWQAATLQPARGPLAWMLWELPWRPSPGQYRLLVRATDGSGAVQPPEPTPSLPDGATGHHTVAVRVV